MAELETEEATAGSVEPLAALARAADHVFATQRANGSWVDRLPSSAVATGAALFALDACGERSAPSLVRAGGVWLRNTQNPDGSWGDAPAAGGQLNATAIAVAALGALDAKASDAAVRAGLGWLEAQGMPAAVEDRARCTMSAVCAQFLALAGLYPPERLRRLPVEVALFPRRAQRKLSFTLPGLLAWGVMQSRTARFAAWRRTLNSLAERRALPWLERLQAFDGFAGGIEESPLMTAIVCFGLARAGVGQPIVERCRRFLLDTRRDDGSWPVNRDLELSASMSLVLGLDAAGHGDDRRLEPARDWILSCRRSEPFFVTGAPGGGWGWSMPSGWPNVDDTSSAILALTALGVARDDPAVEGAATFLRRMQGRDGGWGCFVRSGRFSLDAPCPVFTAHALEALAAGGLDESDRSVARGLRFLRSAQRADGAVYALWYRNWTAGTAAALGAFSTFGLESTVEARRCLAWLRGHQHDDGSWSGDGEGAGTVEETSWALAALIGAGVAADDAAVERAAGWLSARQRPEGDWPPSLVGVYFPSLMYHDDAIATGSALRALGLYRGATT